MSEAISGASKTRHSSKQIIALTLGVLISVGILAAFALSIDWARFSNEFKKLRWEILPLFAVLFSATYFIRAYRWKYLLPNSDSLDVPTLFDAFSLGALAMFLLPFRAGEFVRAYTVQRWLAVPFATGFASVITERAFDVLCLLLIFGVCLSQIDSAPPEIISAAWILGSIAVGILSVMLLCYFSGNLMLSLFRRILRLLLGDKLAALQEKLLHFAAGIIDGFRAIKSTKELAIVFASSLLLWLLFGLLFQIGLWCLAEYPSIWVGLAVNVVVALAIAIPSAPGFLGVYQLGCTLALCGIFGYQTEFALAYAVLTHSLQFVLVLSIGFYTLHKRGIRLGELTAKSEASAAVADCNAA